MRGVARDFARDFSVFNMAGSKLVLEGRISITSFLLGLGVLIIPLLVTFGSHVDWIFDYLTDVNGRIAIALYITVINGFLLIIYKGPLYKVRVRAKQAMCYIFTQYNRTSAITSVKLFYSFGMDFYFPEIKTTSLMFSEDQQITLNCPAGSVFKCT